MERIYEKNLVEIFRVTPNVFFRKGNLRIRHQCNGAFLVSGDTVAAVDVPSMEAAQEMMDESAELFGLPIRYVFLTHGDADHVEGLPLFLDQPVTVFCSHRLIGQLAPEGTSHKAAFVGVDGVLRLRIGALDIELSTIQGTAHSPRDMFIRLLREQILCTGDTAVEFQTLYYHAADVENWIVTLRDLYARGGQSILPGHGEVYPYSHLDAVADFMETVLRAARKCMEPLSRDEILGLEEVKINEMAAKYYSAGGADAVTIREKAGEDAERELRMVIQALVRKLQQ